MTKVKTSTALDREVRVVCVSPESLRFSDGSVLYSHHNQDCCESHYLSFADVTLNDFKDLLFDLQSDDFFERIPDYGIALLPVYGHPIRIPGYGVNNGYYSSNLSLYVVKDRAIVKDFPINDCQKTNWDD